MASSSPKNATAHSAHDTSTPLAVSSSVPGTTVAPGEAAASTVTTPSVNAEPTQYVTNAPSTPPAPSPSRTAIWWRRPRNQPSAPQASPSPPVITANQPSAAI